MRNMSSTIPIIMDLKVEDLGAAIAALANELGVQNQVRRSKRWQVVTDLTNLVDYCFVLDQYADHWHCRALELDRQAAINGLCAIERHYELFE